MDDVEHVLHQGYLRFAHSLIEKVIETSSADAVRSNPQLYSELRDAWLEELSNLVDMSDKKVAVRVNAISNSTASAASTTQIRSPLLLAPLPKLSLGTGREHPKRKLNEKVAATSAIQAANLRYSESNDNDSSIPLLPSKRRRLKPSDIDIHDTDAKFDIVIGLALCVNFDGLIQVQRVALPYQDQHQGRLVAIEKWGCKEKIKKIRIRFKNGDELLTHWPNRSITTPFSDTALDIQHTSKADKADMIQEGDEEDNTHEESGQNVFSTSAFDDLLGDSAHEWVSQFTGDTDAISIVDEVEKLANVHSKASSSLQDDYATIATGERVSIKQMQEMERYFAWRKNHPPIFICDHPALNTSSSAVEGIGLHQEDDPGVHGPEPELVIIGKGKRLVKGDRVMQLTLQDIYIRDEITKRDFLLSDIRFQIESEHLFASSTADAL